MRSHKLIFWIVVVLLLAGLATILFAIFLEALQ